MSDRNCLSFWFPRIRDAGIPVPKTTIVRTDLQLSYLLDGETPEGFEGFLDEIGKACDEIGYPLFLRTGHTSGKHRWSDTCFLKNKESIPSHIANLVEFSALADFIGLDDSVWCIREFLETNPIGFCPDYGGMPVNREFRFFVDDGKILCRHSYWPLKALNQGGLSGDFPFGWYEEFCKLPEGSELDDIAKKAGIACGGRWSVDILETAKGWYLTDMAEADRSFHWDGCPNAK